MNHPPRIPRRRAAAAALLLASVPCASATFYADAGGEGLLDGDGAALLKGGAPTRRRLRFDMLDATGSTSTTGIAQFKRPKAKKKGRRKRAKQAKKGESMSYSKSGKASISMSYGSKSAKASMDYSTWKEAGGKTADVKKEKSKKKEDGRFRAKAKNTKTKDGDGDEDPSNFQVKAKGSKSEESMSYSKSAKANDSMSYSKSAKSEESMSYAKSAKNSLSYGSKSKKEDEEDGRFDAVAKSAKSKGDKGMSHTGGDPDGDMNVGRFKTSRCAKGSKSEDSMSYSKSGKSDSMSYSKSAKNSLSYGSKGGKDSTGRFAVPGAEEEEEGDGTSDRSDGRFDYAKSSKNSLSYGTKGSKSNDSLSYSKSAKSEESLSYDPCAKAGKSKGRISKGGKGLDNTKAPSASPTITPQPTDIPTLNPTMAPTTLCPAEAIYCQCFEEPDFPASYPKWSTNSLPTGSEWEFTVPSPSPNMPNEAACGVGNIVSGNADTLSEVMFSSNPDWPDGYLYFSVWTTVNAPNDSFKWFVNGIQQGEAMDQPEWVEYRVFLEGNGAAKTVMWVYNYMGGEAFEANLDFVYFVPGPASLDPIEAVAEEAIDDVDIEDYEPVEDEMYADAPKEGDEPF